MAITVIERFRGMGYSQASREAANLIARANMTGSWFGLVEQLSELRSIMMRDADHEAQRIVNGL